MQLFRLALPTVAAAIIAAGAQALRARQLAPPDLPATRTAQRFKRDARFARMVTIVAGQSTLAGVVAQIGGTLSVAAGEVPERADERRAPPALVLQDDIGRRTCAV